MTITINGQVVRVSFKHVRDPEHAQRDAWVYGIGGDKPDVRSRHRFVSRIEGETICFLHEPATEKDGEGRWIPGRLIAEGRAFQSRLERLGYNKEKGRRVALAEALKHAGVEKHRAGEAFEQYDARPRVNQQKQAQLDHGIIS